MGRVVLRGTPNWLWVGLKEVFQVLPVVNFKTAWFSIFCHREDCFSKHNFTTHIISCWVSFLKILVHVVFLVELEGFSLKFVLQPLE